MVLQVYRELRHRHADLASKPSVAVISPYKAQVGCTCWWLGVWTFLGTEQALSGCTCVRVPVQPHPLIPLPCLPRACLQVSLLRRLFRAALGEAAAKLVDINTIDGFQVG